MTNNTLKNLFGEVHGLDDKIVEALTKALEAKNLPGFDYIEFKQSLNALAKMNLDEPTAIRSAFATAATVGLTKDKLLSSAAHYKQVLSNEQTQFEAAMQKQIQQRVDGKQAEVDSLKKKVLQYEEEIEKLKNMIAAAQTTIDNADNDMQTAKDRISQTRENFELTYNSILNQIEKDIANVNTYL